MMTEPIDHRHRERAEQCKADPQKAAFHQEVSAGGVKKTTTPAFYATIWIGTQIGNDNHGETVPIEEVYRVAHDFCDKHCLCVTVTPTDYVYPGARQSGVAVRIVQYLKRPRTPEEIKDRACELAEKPRNACGQLGVMVETPHRILWRSVER